MDYAYVRATSQGFWVNVIMLGCGATQYGMMLIVRCVSSMHVKTVVFFRSACTVQCSTFFVRRDIRQTGPLPS